MFDNYTYYKNHNRQNGNTTMATARHALVENLRKSAIRDERVLAAIASIPRHSFVDSALEHRAYENVPLPISHGQTISQPYIVALMTQELIKGGELERVLEIGTGSGYQTAILAGLFDRVVSVERIAALQLSAEGRLYRMGIRNVEYIYGNGGEGAISHAPYDGIIVTAAASEILERLCRQLKDGGRLLIPVGDGGTQNLYRIERTGAAFRKELISPVRFVPLITESNK